jgi:hypothetical protein
MSRLEDLKEIYNQFVWAVQQCEADRGACGDDVYTAMAKLNTIIFEELNK